MPVTILVVSLVLLMFGLGSFVMGVSLTPTDMARAWLVVGATLFSGGMISLAIGFAVQSVTLALTRSGAPFATASDDLPPDTGIASAASEVAPAPVSQAADPSRLATGGMVAAGAAVLGAGAATLATLREPAPADDFERDLFSAQPEAKPEERPAAFAQEELPALPELDLRLSPAPAPEELVLPTADPEPPVSADPSEVIDEPEDADEQEVAAAPPAVPGLIADEDLAALQAEEAPLAPLETLDVVGAYDSGGVRFTMYSDGSVHAAGPGGEQRYRSLEALRKRLDAGLSAV